MRRQPSPKAHQERGIHRAEQTAHANEPERQILSAGSAAQEGQSIKAKLGQQGSLIKDMVQQRSVREQDSQQAKRGQPPQNLVRKKAEPRPAVPRRKQPPERRQALIAARPNAGTPAKLGLKRGRRFLESSAVGS